MFRGMHNFLEVPAGSTCDGTGALMRSTELRRRPDSDELAGPRWVLRRALYQANKARYSIDSR